MVYIECLKMDSFVISRLKIFRSKMGFEIITGIATFFFFLLLIEYTDGAEFYVRKHGAKGDGRTDDSQAVMGAWRQACSSRYTSKIVITKGKYLVGPLTFEGPCKASIGFVIQGTLQAPSDLRKLKSKDDWIVFHNIDRLMVSGGGTFDGQGSLAWTEKDFSKSGRKWRSLPINLRFNGLTNSRIRNITSLNSKLFHMNILNCQNVTLENIIIDAPGDSRNTDGIHIGRSTHINVTHANIKTGDDCVSLGDGSRQINIEKVTCGPGHGISIGSLGKYRNEQPVRGVRVRNCTLTSTMFGVRVKTWPASPIGFASDLHFEDIIMNNVGTPIFIDQQYCPYGHCQAKIPSRVRINNISFEKIRGTSATKLAMKLICSRGSPCQNVKISDINLTYGGGRKGVAATSQCVNVKPTISGRLVPPPCSEWNSAAS